MGGKLRKRLICFGFYGDDHTATSNFNENSIELRIVGSYLCWREFCSWLGYTNSKSVATIERHCVVSTKRNIEIRGFENLENTFKCSCSTGGSEWKERNSERCLESLHWRRSRRGVQERCHALQISLQPLRESNETKDQGNLLELCYYELE